MTAQTGSGIEGLEAKRLRFGRLNHFPDVNAHPVEEHLELVHHGDVHRPVGIFQDFGRFGRAAGGNRHGPHDNLVVEGFGHFQTGRGEAADHLGDGRRGVILVVGVLALGGEGQEEVPAGSKSGAFLQDVPHVLVGRAGVGG